MESLLLRLDVEYSTCLGEQLAGKVPKSVFSVKEYFM